MKYGVHWTARVAEASTLGGIAKQAEDLGFESFGLPDHLLTSRPLVDPFMGLTAAAEATSSIKLSTMVVLSGLRRGVQLAREAASLQSISGNRLELGMGAGWVEKEKAVLERWTGSTPFRRIKTDLELLDCAFPRGESGVECTDPDHLIAQSVAVGSERPTLMIAAGGPRMLEIAARLGDIVMLTVPTDRRENGEKPSIDLLRDQVAAVNAYSPQSPPQIQFQIREYTPETGQQADDLWALRGSRSEIKERLNTLESLGVGYISLCTNSIETMEEFANDIF